MSLEAFDLRHGDALQRLREMPDESVHCCVTSPPYCGLRDYGTGSWEGGDAGCDHIEQRKNPTVESSSTLGYPADGSARRIADQNTYHNAYTKQFRGTCGVCGAQRIDGQIGMEPTPAEFITRLVDVFREVRRVLRSDGTCFVNIGDSFAANRSYQVPSTKGGQKHSPAQAKQSNNKVPAGLKPKDLIGIPWALAFALRDDGWWLRQDIIWHKPNPMPESVQDRCTKAHEYVFLLTKSARYWWDADAISEPATDTGRINGRDGRSEQPQARPPGSGPRTLARIDYSQLGRNRRSVWTLASQPTPESHFAVFPIELPELCIRAGCPAGGLVLDPFAGLATTGLACLKNNRRFIGIELSAEYIAMAWNRARKYYPLMVTA